MPIRAEGSQLTGIVCASGASSALGTGAEEQRTRDQETHQLNKQMAHIKMDGSENVEKLYTKLTMKKAGK